MSFMMGSWKNPVSPTKLKRMPCFLNALIMGSALALLLHKYCYVLRGYFFRSSLTVSRI